MNEINLLPIKYFQTQKYKSRKILMGFGTFFEVVLICSASYMLLCKSEIQEQRNTYLKSQLEDEAYASIMYLQEDMNTLKAQKEDWEIFCTSARQGTSSMMEHINTIFKETPQTIQIRGIKISHKAKDIEILVSAEEIKTIIKYGLTLQTIFKNATLQFTPKDMSEYAQAELVLMFDKEQTEAAP